MNSYKFVASENELRWFFDHVIEKPEPNESYLMCISSRAKKVDPEERKRIQLGRGEMMREQVLTSRGKEKIWDFNWFKSFFYRYECPYEGMITKAGYPYPQESLVLYFYVNPSDEHKVAMDSTNHIVGILSDLVNAATLSSKDGLQEQLFKMRTVDTHKKTCRATNISRHLWTQFDYDFSDDVKQSEEMQDIVLQSICRAGEMLYNKGNYVVIRTSGGFHILVHKRGMEYWNKNVRNQLDTIEFGFNFKTFNPIDDFIKLTGQWIIKLSEKLPATGQRWFEEFVKTNQSFLPCPGTWQYGNFMVEVVNKQDF